MINFARGFMELPHELGMTRVEQRIFPDEHLIFFGNRVLQLSGYGNLWRISGCANDLSAFFRSDRRSTLVEQHVRRVLLDLAIVAIAFEEPSESSIANLCRIE